jgi:hypothetical protein
MPLQSPAVLDLPVKINAFDNLFLLGAADFQYRVLTAPPRVLERVFPAVPLSITVRDHLTNRYPGESDGDIIYPLVREALLSGLKVILSVKGVSVSGGFFFKTAIFRAYGEFPESTVDRDIEVIDMTKSESADMEEMREFCKFYHYDRASYDKWYAEWVSGWEELLNDNSDFVSDAEIEPLAPDEDFARAITIDELMVNLRESWDEMDRKVNEWQ